MRLGKNDYGITPEDWVDEWCEYYGNNYDRVRAFMVDYRSTRPNIHAWWWTDACYHLDCRVEMAWLD